MTDHTLTSNWIHSEVLIVVEANRARNALGLGSKHFQNHVGVVAMAPRAECGIGQLVLAVVLRNRVTGVAVEARRTGRRAARKLGEMVFVREARRSAIGARADRATKQQRNGQDSRKARQALRHRESL